MNAKWIEIEWILKLELRKQDMEKLIFWQEFDGSETEFAAESSQ